MKRKNGQVHTSPTVIKALAWLNSFAKASKWMGKYDIHRMLDEGGGLFRVERDFLPLFVADAVLEVLQAIPTSKWNPTAAGEDYAHNNISHVFFSTKHASAIIDAVVRAIGLLLPGQLNAFGAARYDTSHHIAPHDDRAYTPVQLDTGEMITCSREIGVIWYLTKDWREEFGGALVDLEGGRAYVPQFNSAVAFRVPRFHEVTPVTTPRPRYSIFGWFLQPGKQYELYTGEGPAQQWQQAQQGGRLAIGVGGGDGSSGRGGRGAKRRNGVATGAAEQGQGQGQQQAGAKYAEEEAAGEYACKLARRIARNAAKSGRQAAAAAQN